MKHLEPTAPFVFHWKRRAMHAMRQRSNLASECPPDPDFFHKEKLMSKRSWMLVTVAASLLAGVAYAQYPIMDAVANKVVQKYQTSTCEQLWQEKAQKQGQPKPEMEQRAIKALQGDPQMRQAFFNKVSGPIVNKMFECGMIP